MLCVRALEASRRFYVDGIGMKLLDRMDIDFKPRVSALFIGFDPKESALTRISAHGRGAMCVEVDRNGTGLPT